MKCQFCSADAVAVYILDRGCYCCPGPGEHAYCIQHILRATPLGSMELKEVLLADKYDWFLEWQEEKSNSKCKKA